MITLVFPLNRRPQYRLVVHIVAMAAMSDDDEEHPAGDPSADKWAYPPSLTHRAKESRESSELGPTDDPHVTFSPVFSAAPSGT
jgi:hypothetical protein